MQFFRIKYSCFNTHVVSMKSGQKVVPRLLNPLRPQIPLARIFDMSELLTIKEEIQFNLTVEELSLDQLYFYLMKRNGHQLTKYAPILKEAWSSFTTINEKQRRSNRKIGSEQIEQIIQLFEEGVPKAKIARIVGVSRVGLYKAIEKIENENLLKKCREEGYFQQVCEDAYNACPKDAPWYEKVSRRDEAKLALINKLIGFDISILKINKVQT